MDASCIFYKLTHFRFMSLIIVLNENVQYHQKINIIKNYNINIDYRYMDHSIMLTQFRLVTVNK